uniref:Uncharacterized protein n=1 Tax=Arundo donax TaxID=35708 RepID=A0A0A9EQ94_ARUDO
MFTYLFISSVS